MAYYDDELEQQGQQQGQQQELVAGQGTATTGPQSGVVGTTAGGAVGGNANAPKTAPGSSPDNPGNFVSLNQYLAANKPQAARLGGQVGTQVKGSINEAQQGIQNVGQGFQTAAKAGQIQNLDTAEQEAQQIANKAATGQIGDTDKERFKQISTAEYKGPKTLQEAEGYNPAVQSVQKAQKYADLTKSEAGNRELLKDFYKAPKYTAGENLLDSYLLESSGNRQKLAGARAEAQNLGSKLTQEEQKAADLAQQQKDLAQSTQQAARTGLESIRSGRTADINKELKGISKDWKSEYQKYVDILNNASKTGKVVGTPEQIKALGLEKGQRIYNVLNGFDPEHQGFINQQAFDPNKVISKEQQAQLAALDELAKQYGGSVTNIYNNPELAGTLTKAGSLDTSGLGEAAKTADELFKNAIKNVDFSRDVSWEDSSGRSDLDRLMGTGTSSGTTKASVNLEDYLNRGNAAFKQGLAGHGNYGENVTSAMDQMRNDILNYLQNAGYNKGVDVQEFNPEASPVVENQYLPAQSPLGPNPSWSETIIPGFKVPDFEIPTFEVPNLCFVENTPIMMADGSFKMVQDIKLDDEVAFGGKILGTGVAYHNNIYYHKGVQITNTHMIFEEGQYIRAENNPNTLKIRCLEAIKIYPLISENHILVSNNGVVYCDLIEIDLPEANNNERLEALNTKEYIEKALNIEAQLKVKVKGA